MTQLAQTNALMQLPQLEFRNEFHIQFTDRDSIKILTKMVENGH